MCRTSTICNIGSFQILSLGDCENIEIAKRIMANEILQREVDIMILAHHGADNGFTTLEFLKTIKPKVCILFVRLWKQI